MARLLTLNEVIKELDELPEFMDWAVNYLSRKDTLSTYTHASSVTAILDYWMLDGELPFYECGDLKCGKDILDALVYPDHKGDYQAGMESLLNTWKINPQELVALIQQEGFAQPECLRALAPIESPALINHAGTEPKERELMAWLRETWINEGSKLGGTAFFTKLKKYVNKDGSPIVEHYSAGKSAGFRWETSAGATGTTTKKTIQNHVSVFKNKP